MRKTITTMGLGLALTLGAAVAGAQATQADSTHHRGGWQRGEEHGGRGMRGARGEHGFGRMLLLGITLTDAQKQQL